MDRCRFPAQIPVLLLLVCCLSQACHALQQAEWRSCAPHDAAFDVQAVDLLPSSTISPGGSLRLVVTVFNKQPQVTAGAATVKVYYYGWWVLTASGTMCEAPAHPSAAAEAAAAARRRRSLLLLQHGAAPAAASSRAAAAAPPRLVPRWRAAAGVADDPTCVLPGGTLQLHHDATLPAVAPRGSYSMQLSASDAANGQQLLCVNVWFRVA